MKNAKCKKQKSIDNETVYEPLFMNVSIRMFNVCACRVSKNIKHFNFFSRHNNNDG